MVRTIWISVSRLILAGLLGGSVPSVASAHEEPAPEDQIACAQPDGWFAVEARDPRFVVFGEVHGTAESPRLIGDVLCGLAMRGKRVLLAIEFSSNHNAALQTAWQVEESDFREALRQGGWERRKDGVGSVAMLELVERAHRIKSQGSAIDIVAFNGARDGEQRDRFAHLEGQGPHEAAQAENIALAADAADYDIIIVLVGNFHAKKDRVTTGDATFETMASRLEQYGSVISLNNASAGGTSWNCQLRDDFEFVHGAPIPSDAMQCRAFPASGWPDLNLPPFIALDARGEAEPVFDGYFWLGQISASPPAFANAAE
ncbi:MAG: hypothetical protein ABJN35_10235 [Erythrobacter sp.]